MRCRLVRDFRFEAAHSLPNVPEGHKCKRVHGHSYRVAVTIEGEIASGLGWVMDFADVDAVVDPVIGELDHRMLNELDGLENPTSELLAVWIWRRLERALPLMIELSVSETPDSRCIYRGE